MKRLFFMIVACLLSLPAGAALTPTFLCKFAPTSTARATMNCTASSNGGIVAGRPFVVFTTMRSANVEAAGSNTFLISDTDANVFWPVNTDLCYTQAAAANWPCQQESNANRGNIAWIVNSAKSTDTTDVITVSWTTNSTYAGMWVIGGPSGMAADVWDGSANAASSSAGTTFGPGAASGSGSNSGDLVLNFCASSNAVTTGSGMTSLEAATAGYLVQYQTGPGNANVTCGDGSSNFSIAAETLTLRPAGTYSGIYVRQHTSPAVTQGSVGISCKLGITGTPGGTLLFVAGQSAGVDTLSATDSGSSTWTSIISRQGTACEGGTSCLTAYLPNAAANKTWVGVSGTGGDNGSCNMIEVAGIATSSPLDQSTDTQSTATSWSSGSVTTASVNEIAIGAFLGMPITGPLSSLTVGGSWVETSPNGNPANVSMIGTQILTSKQTLAFTGTQAGTGTLNNDAGIATFIGASQGSAATAMPFVADNYDNPYLFNFHRDVDLLSGLSRTRTLDSGN